jgi:AraC-like DNA-binding protein
MIPTDQDATQLIYKGTLVHIGQFRRGPEHPDFRGPHCIGGMLMVFPRTSVMITHAGRQPILADPNTVMFYNNKQIYSRDKLSDQGDLCEWFAVDPRRISDAIRPFNPYVDEHPCTLFEFSYGPSDPASYLLQRMVVDHILKHPQPDHLFIEETVLSVLARVTINSYRQRGISPQKANTAHEHEIVNAIREILAKQFDQELSLDFIAAQLHYSPFHLCRIFQKHTGQSIHQYLKHLRLNISLEYVTQPGMDLTNLALKLGFSSHSHFTESFRKTFGAPPSALRNTSSSRLHTLQSKISIA